MVIRIRLRLSSVSLAGFARQRELAAVLSALLSPAAVVALALAFWRLGADLELTGRFAISHGLFSRWQVWLLMAGALQGAASLLGRYARGSASARRPPQRYGGRDQAIP